MHGRDVSKGPYIISCDLNALLRGMRQRRSSYPIDKICAIAFPFMKRNYSLRFDMTLPIYDSNTPTSVAWEKLISSLASTTMEFDEVSLEMYVEFGQSEDDEWEDDEWEDGEWEDDQSEDDQSEDDRSEYDQSEDDRSEYDQSKGLSLPYTATTQLLCLFPHPSKHHWFPSWSQVQQYPDVSVRDSDPSDSDQSQTASGIDYSLRIMSGRIYRGCSLQLIKPPTPNTKAIYCSTVDGKDAQLVATVPGIELHIDSSSKYVLVDISPDLSLWPENIDKTCRNTDEGHEHLPIWPKSMIIVCLECPSADMNYRLRRVTTLEWECRQPVKPDPGCWLPFEPSLVHMRSIVCSAKGREFLKSLDNEDSDSSDSSDNEDIDLNVFCDPVVVASLMSQERWYKDWPQGWHSQWPTCEVYVM